MDNEAKGLVETPTDSTPIDLGDGKERTIRFTLGKLKKLKKKFGSSLMQTGLRDLDEEQLPEIIRMGLEGPESEKPSIEWFDNIEIKLIPVLIETVVKAWFKAMPKNEPPLTTEDLQTFRRLLAELDDYTARTRQAIAGMESMNAKAESTS